MHGFPETFPTPILEVVVGSTLHGTAVDDGLEDLDLMAIVVEPPSQFIGFVPKDTWVHRTKPDGVRSEAGDVDLTVYGLRKFLHLALKGNPTILLAFFVPDQFIKRHDVRGEQLQALYPYVVSKQVYAPFRGYMKQQHERLLGLRGQRNVTRPELVDRFGFDCYCDDTDFLTERGWLRYDEILDDERIGTVNASGAVEFQHFTERVKRIYSGLMLLGKTRYSEWFVTPNHRMLVSKVERGSYDANGLKYAESRASWKFRPAKELTRVHWHQRVAASPRIEESSIQDSYLKLIGAFVSEGCVGKRLSDKTASLLRFEQADGGRLHAVMEAIVDDYSFREYKYGPRTANRKPTTIWTLADVDTAHAVDISCGKGSANKRLPKWFTGLSTRQANVLLDALLAGDGTPYRTGGWVYYTTSPRLADDVQALAVIAGRRSLKWGPYQAGMYQIFMQEPGNEIAAFRGTQDVKVVDVVNQPIVCFTVANETLITRRNGRVAFHGNTKYASQIIRLGFQGEELLTIGKLTFPMAWDQRDLVIKVRTGLFSLAAVSELIIEAEKRIEAAMQKSALPEQPDYKTVEGWMLRTYLSAWRAVEPSYFGEPWPAKAIDE